MKHYPLRTRVPLVGKKAASCRVSFRPVPYAQHEHVEVRRLRVHPNNSVASPTDRLSWKDAVTITPPAYAAARIQEIDRRAFEISGLGHTHRWSPPPRDNVSGVDHTVNRPIRTSRPLENVQVSEDDPGEYIVYMVRDYIDIKSKTLGEPYKLFYPGRNVLFPTRYAREDLGVDKLDRPDIAFSPVAADVEFPEPQDLDVNMMPFVYGEPESLPPELRPYYSNLIASCPIQEHDIGKVMYLTVQENQVEKGTTQRRPGLHVEAPGAGTGEVVARGHKVVAGGFLAAQEHTWGSGFVSGGDTFHDGIYMASNMDNTAAVWNAIVDTRKGEVTSEGSVAHLRPLIGDGFLLPANLLVWMTDKTPHEAIPQENGGYRQYFRLVTSRVSVWFEQHSSLNPNVPLPDHVQVVKGNKFKPDA